MILIFKRLAVLVLVAVPLVAQDGLRQMILSDRVGAEIDPAERMQFSLFKQYDFFVSGSFFQLPDSSYGCRIAQDPPASAPETTWVTYQYPLLLMIAERIEHYEELRNGKYTMGAMPPTIRYSTGEPVIYVPRSLIAAPKEQPVQARPVASVHALRKYPDVFRYAVHYPHLGIGMGIMGGFAISGGDAYGEKMVQRIDSKRSYLSAEVVLELSRTMSVSLLAGMPVSKPREGLGAQKASLGAVSFRYLYIFSTFAAVAEAGYVGMNYTLKDSPYGNGFDFDVSLAGIMLGAGIELCLTQSFSVLARARYISTGSVTGTYMSLMEGKQQAEVFARALTYDIQLCYYY